MNLFFQTARLFFSSDDGPTTTEYAVLIAVICIAAIGALSAFGVHMNAIYASISSTVPTGAAS